MKTKYRFTIFGSFIFKWIKNFGQKKSPFNFIGNACNYLHSQKNMGNNIWLYVTTPYSVFDHGNSSTQIIHTQECPTTSAQQVSVDLCSYLLNRRKNWNKTLFSDLHRRFEETQNSQCAICFTSTFQQLYTIWGDSFHENVKKTYAGANILYNKLVTVIRTHEHCVLRSGGFIRFFPLEIGYYK